MTEIKIQELERKLSSANFQFNSNIFPLGENKFSLAMVVHTAEGDFFLVSSHIKNLKRAEKGGVTPKTCCNHVQILSPTICLESCEDESNVTAYELARKYGVSANKYGKTNSFNYSVEVASILTILDSIDKVKGAYLSLIPQKNK